MKTFIDTFSKDFSNYSRKATVFKTGKSRFIVEQVVDGNKYKPSIFDDEKSACDYAKKVTHNGSKVNGYVNDIKLLNSDGDSDMDIYATPKNTSFDNEKMERQIIQKLLTNIGPIYYHGELSLEPWNSTAKYRVRFWTNQNKPHISWNFRSKVKAFKAMNEMLIKVHTENNWALLATY